MSDMILMNSVFGNFTTGNIIIDIALRTMILTAITGVMNYISTKMDVMDLYHNVHKFLYKQKKYPEIIMEAEPVDIMSCGKKVGVKMNYSKAFLAVLHYINTRPQLKIRVFKETTSFNETRDKDSSYMMRKEYEEYERALRLNDKYYIPFTEEDFLLEQQCEIMCNIDINIRKVKSKSSDGKDNETNINIHQIQLYIKSGTMSDLQTFMNKCIMEHEKYQQIQMGDKQYCFHFRQCVDIDDVIQAEWDEIEFNTNKSFDHVFFEKKNELMEQIDFFMNNASWYKKHGIPHHLGILLYGTPGCGKTSCIKVIAQRTGYSIIVINLNRIKSSRELETIFFSPTINKKHIPNNKRIYVFEDIDCLSSVVLDRSEANSASASQCGDEEEQSIMKLASALVKSQKAECILLSDRENDKLNLSCILNLLDGIVETPGRIVIMTSNYPEKIDSALKRPGRMDIHIELKKASKEVILDLLSNFYEIPVETLTSMYESEIAAIREYHFSPAQVSNFCVMNKTNIKNCFALLAV
jgi:ATP-dependent 26S proteasome regulatory subunit